MPIASTNVRVSADKQYIMASGEFSCYFLCSKCTKILIKVGSVGKCHVHESMSCEVCFKVPIYEKPRHFKFQ